MSDTAKNILIYCFITSLTPTLGFAQGIADERIEVRNFRNEDAKDAAIERAGSAHRHSHAHSHGVETENLFGFTLGSSTEPLGTTELAIETVARVGKRQSSYSAVTQKIEFSRAFSDRLTSSVSLLGDYHRVVANPDFSNDVENVKRGYIFNGVGAELRYNLINRNINSFGLTFHIEPNIALSDEATGLRGRKYGSENKIIFDFEAIEKTLFLAFNITQEIEVVKEKNSLAWERASVVGASMAMAYQLKSNLFIGAEARYLRSYQGLNLRALNGDAWYAGPTISIQNDKHQWISASYNILVGGKEKGSSSNLDLNNFERHQLRIKAGLSF